MDIETLRPNGVGTNTTLDTQVPDSGEHWEKVDEDPADDADYVAHESQLAGANGTDTYLLPDSAVGAGTINSVTVHCRARNNVNPGFSKVAPAIYTHAAVHYGTQADLTAAWADYSKVWATNPDTGNPWTWAEINALEAGVYLEGSANTNRIPWCSQVYVVVDYTPYAGWAGKISGVTNPAKVMGVDSINIAKVKGV